MQLLRTGDHATLPWKNGLGESRVIASRPPAAGYDAVDWQVGTTGIAFDCPFSSLPGMDRQFMLLEGAGVELSCVDVIAGMNLRHAVNTPFVPFAFRGDWQTTCRLLGDPVEVFNVMTRRDRVAAKIVMPRWAGPLFCEQRPGETVVAVVLAGNVTAPASPVPLAPGEAVMLDEPKGERCVLESGAAQARLAIVRFAPA